MQLKSPMAELLTKPHVEVRELNRMFGTVGALETVDLTIAAGEFIALLGPSGCGKTTLLRCIAGLLRPTSGDILIDGRSIVSTPTHQRGLGMVFQSYALFPHMTVLENIRFGLKMRKVEAAEGQRRIADMIELVQLHGFERRYPSQLSGGQQQRVSLARALVIQPSVLLLDEPFGALDAKLREAMQLELRRMQRKLNVTMIFVTHDQSEALSMADRVAVMRGGRVEQFDTPTRVYDAPATAFVADFIGQMNRFSGRLVDRSGGRARVAIAGFPDPLEARDNAAISLGEQVQAMIRPERLQMCDDKASMLEGTATDIVFNGERLNVFVHTPAGVVSVARPNMGVDAAAGGEVGRRVCLSWAPEDLLIFAAS
jgi:spermidine/putrescine ABC transporter ATP-binding subunit